MRTFRRNFHRHSISLNSTIANGRIEGSWMDERWSPHLLKFSMNFKILTTSIRRLVVICMVSLLRTLEMAYLTFKCFQFLATGFTHTPVWYLIYLSFYPVYLLTYISNSFSYNVYLLTYLSIYPVYLLIYLSNNLFPTLFIYFHTYLSTLFIYSHTYLTIFFLPCLSTYIPI